MTAAAAPAHRRQLTVSVRWPAGAGPLLVGVACALPLVFVLVSSFVVSPPGTPRAYGLGNWTSAFSYPGSLKAMGHSVTLSLVREAISLPVALGLTWLVTRTDMPGRRLIEGAAWLSIFVPILPLTLGWILLSDPHNGLLNDVTKAIFGKALFNIYGFWGIVWVYLASHAIAFKVALLAPTFRRVGADLEDAGRICGASRWQAFTRITVPVLAPGVLFVILGGIVFSLQGFQVELLLGEPVRYFVYATQIYTLVNDTPPLNGQAAALGTVFLAILLVLTYFYLRHLRSRSFLTVTGRGYAVKLVPLRAWRWPAGIACTLGFAVMIGLPFVMLVIGSFMRLYGFFNVSHPFTLAQWSSVLSDPLFASSFVHSLIIGAGSAAGTVVVYLLVAHSLARHRSPLLRVAEHLLWAPWAAPGILMSLGMLGLFLYTPLRTVLFGSLLGLIIAFVLQHAPLASQLFRSSLVQIGPEMEEAARICGAARTRVYIHVLARLLAPTAIAVASIAFLLSLQEIPLVILLYTPQSQPLPILMLNYSTTSSAQGAVVGVLTTAIAMGVLLALRSVAGRLLRERAA